MHCVKSADKANAVQAALKHPQGAKMSDNALAVALASRS
jgi:hypothetical protein